MITLSGTLKAVGIQNGKETVPVVLKTAGEARTIKLNTDRTMIKANGQDLSFATVEIFDENGTKQPNAENELTFNIDGPGGIAAVGNANLKDTDTYVSNKRNAWKGRALVVIKSNKTAGNIRLTVSSPGLKSASMVIRSVK